MNSYDRLSQLLNRYRRRTIAFTAFRFLAVLILVHGAILTAAGLMSLFQPLDATPLRILAYSYALYLLFPPALIFIARMRGHSLRESAVRLDRLHSQAPDPFRTLLSRHIHPPKTQILLDRLFEDSIPALTLPPWNPGRLFPGLLILGLLTPMAAALFSPAPVEFSSRILNPWGKLANLPLLVFTVEAPRQVLPAGDSARVIAKLRGWVEGQTIHARVVQGDEEVRFPLAAADSLYFAFGPLTRDASIRLEAANGRSRTLDFRVRIPPGLASLSAVVVSPGYTRKPPDTLPVGLGNFSALAGSRIIWTVAASRNLSAFTWHFSDTDDSGKALADSQSLGSGSRFRWDKQLRNSLSYGFVLVDGEGVSNRLENAFRVDLLPDAHPEIRILAPDDGYSLGREMRVPVQLQVRDDYGLISLYLEYRVLSDGFVKDEGRIALPDWLRGSKAGLVHQVWNLDSLELRPENVVEYSFLAYDNDSVNGPKPGRSEMRTLRLPTVREMIADARKEEESAVSALQSALRRQRQLERKLKKLAPEDRENAPPSVTDFDVNRIMRQDPMQHKQRAEAALKQVMKKMEAAKKSHSEAKGAEATQAWEKAMGEKEKAIPLNPIGLTTDERVKALEKLSHAQKRELEEMQRLQSELEKTPNSDPLDKKQMESLKDELRKNLTDQKNLRDFFEDESRRNTERDKLLEQSLEEQTEMAQDMREAERNLSELIEKGMQENLISPEILAKMEKIQEMLKEVIPENLREMLEKQAASEEVDAADLHRELKKLMDRQQELEQTLNRALSMLEGMKQRKQMQEWEKMLADLEKREAEVAKSLESGAKKDEMMARQESIAKQSRDLFGEMGDSKSGSKSPALDQGKRDNVLKEMEAVAENLRKGGESAEKKAAQSATKASRELGRMRESLAQSLGGGSDQGLDLHAIQGLIQESLELSRMQILVQSGQSRREKAGWNGGETGLYASVHQIARSLDAGIKEMAGRLPFPARVLLDESRNLVDASLEASQSWQLESSRKAVVHNQRVTRELLKLQSLAQSMAGSGQGEGEPGSDSQGQGQGQPGGEDLSSRLKGMGGKQMAVNQATYELLKAMLEGRGEGGGPGPTLQELANQEGMLSEQLEAMAETAGDEAGAARNLRNLAEEARALEEDLRKGRFSPQDMKNRQDRFQAKLLDAARALEQRGEEKEREGKIASEKRRLFEARPADPPDALLQMLKAARQESRELELTGAQRRLLEEYYQTLMTR